MRARSVVERPHTPDSRGGNDGRERLREAGARHDRLGDRAHRTTRTSWSPRSTRTRTLYDEGHIRGAVRLHWRDDLQDPVERDLIERAEFEKLMGGLGISNDTTVVLYGDRNNWFAAYAYWYLKIYGHNDVRILDGGRQKWIDEDRELTTEAPSRSAATYTANERDASIRTFRDDVLVRARRQRARARRRAQPAGVLGRADRAARLRAGRRAARRAHSDRAVDPVGVGRARRRNVQERGRAEAALRRQGRDARQEGDRVLPDRRAQRAHVVRACASCSATRTSATTTARGRNGATSSTSRSRRAPRSGVRALASKARAPRPC